MTESNERDFAQWVAEFSHGATNRAMTEKLRALVTACRETGRKGSLGLKIEVKADGAMATVTATIKSNNPEAALPGAFYFTDESGELHDEDPRQLKLPTKILEPAEQTLRTIKIARVDHE